MLKHERETWPKRFLGRSHAPRLLRALMGFAVVAFMLHVGMRYFMRPKFDLMYNARCVHLPKGHLDVSYAREDACFSRLQVQKILTDLVLDSSVVFDAHKITYFLDSGTLLGCYRNGSVIPHDYDADMGIDEQSLAYIQNNAISFPDKYALHVYNSKIHTGGYRDKALPVRVVHKESGLYMDVFEYIDVIDAKTRTKVTGPPPSSCFCECKSCPKVAPGRWQFQIPHDWIYPLHLCSFGGRLLKCPAQSDKYLSYMFGADYMTPAFDYTR